MSQEAVSRALRDLKAHITTESDPEKLRELVIEINILLSLIEEQAAKLEGNQPPPSH